MALSITKESSKEIWSIPVAGYGDNNWKDNTWIVEHLRQLADKIEQENPRIYSVRLNSSLQYSPNIELEVFPNLKHNTNA